MQPIEDKVILYRYRWLILLIVSLLNVSNQIVWLSYASIAYISSSFYDVNLTWINLFSVIYLFMYLPFGFTSSWVLDTRGLKFGVLVGTWANLIGAWLRFIACFFPTPHSKYAIAFIGQTISGAAQPFLLNSPTKLAANWFPPHQRAVANMLCSMSPIVGIAIGSVMSPFIVSGESDMKWLLLIVAIIAGVIGALATFGMRDKPPTPPSLLMNEAVSDSFKTGLQKLIHNRSYVILVVSFGVGVGVFNSVATILAQIIHPYGYTDDDAGIFSGVMIVFGLIGAGITAPIVDKTHRYKEIYIIGYVLALCMFLFFTLSIRPDLYALILVSCAALGATAFSLVAVAFELAVELTYPVAEGTSAGFLWMSGQVWAIIMIFSASGFSEEDVHNVCWFYFALVILAVASSYFLKPEYRRINAEMQRKSTPLKELTKEDVPQDIDP